MIDIMEYMNNMGAPATPQMPDLGVETNSPKLGLNESEISYFIDTKYDAARHAPSYTRLLDSYAKYYRMYNRQFSNKTIDSFRSRIYLGTAFSFVEAARSQIRASIFKSQDLIQVRPRINTPNAQFKAENMRILLNYYARQGGFQERILDVLNFVLKWGNAPVMSGWEFKTNIIRSRKFREAPEFGGAIIDQGDEEQLIIEKDQPVIEPFDPRDVLWDPSARWVDEASYCILIPRTTVHQMKMEADSQEWINIDRLEKDIPNGQQIYSADNRNANESSYWGRDSQNQRSDTYKAEVELLDYWGIVCHPNAPTTNIIWNLTKVKGTNLIVRARVSPYPHGKLPIVNGTITPVENAIHGIGLLETVADEQQMGNFMINNRLDSFARLTNPTLLAWKGAFKDPSAIARTAPGQIIDVNSRMDLDKAVKQLEVVDQGGQTFRQMFELVNQLMERNTSISPNGLGMVNRVQRSATEVASASQGSEGRSSDQIFTLTTTLFQPLFRQIMQLTQGNISSEMTVPILGGKTSDTIEPWMIQGDFELEVDTGVSLNREMTAQILAQTLASTAPYAQAGLIDPLPLLKAIFKSNPIFDEFNIEEIVKAPQMQQLLMNPQGGGAQGVSTNAQASGGVATRATQPGAGGPRIG